MTGADANGLEYSDRALAARFAPSTVRARLDAFHAWLDEIEQIPFKVSEPAILAMRFAWHREAIADLFAAPQKVRRHDAYEGLAALVGISGSPTSEELIALIDAVEDGLNPGGVADMPALLRVIDAHHGAVMRIGENLAGSGESPDMRKAAARASGLAQWIRQFAFRAGRKLALAPRNAMDASGFNEHRLASGREPKLAAEAMAPVFSALETELSQLWTLGPCPPASLPVLGPARLARATLKTAQRSTDLYRTDFRRPLLARQFDLLRASLTGRL
jgi:phytoene/squalene synthetase